MCEIMKELYYVLTEKELREKYSNLKTTRSNWRLEETHSEGASLTHMDRDLKLGRVFLMEEDHPYSRYNRIFGNIDENYSLIAKWACKKL